MTRVVATPYHVWLKRFKLSLKHIMALPLAMRLCLGDMPIPFRQQKLLFSDIHDVADVDADMELHVDGYMEFLLLDLKASHDARWLERGWACHRDGGPKHCTSLPLIQEILQTIVTTKNKKAQSAICRGNHISSWPSKFAKRSSWCRTIRTM